MGRFTGVGSHVDDQIGAPTGAELIADITAHALRHCEQQPAASGLYHLAATGECSVSGSQEGGRVAVVRDHAQNVLALDPDNGPVGLSNSLVGLVQEDIYPSL